MKLEKKTNSEMREIRKRKKWRWNRWDDDSSCEVSDGFREEKNKRTLSENL